LLVGLVIGPHGLQFIAASAETKFLAELGVIFLMFMVGLEFSPSADSPWDFCFSRMLRRFRSYRDRRLATK
jgi:Sodium/hydrogen exchanger family